MLRFHFTAFKMILQLIRYYIILLAWRNAIGAFEESIYSDTLLNPCMNSNSFWKNESLLGFLGPPSYHYQKKIFSIFLTCLLIIFFVTSARTSGTVLSDNSDISILIYDFNRNDFRVAIFEWYFLSLSLRNRFFPLLF